KERANVLRDLPRKRCPLIVHGQHHALDLQSRIERGLDLLDVLFELRDTLESEELALNRHEHRVRSDHRAERQQIERRRAIDEDIRDGFLRVYPLLTNQATNSIAHPERPRRLVHELLFDPYQVRICRDDRKSRNLRLDGRIEKTAPHHHDVVGREGALLHANPEPGRCVTLRIEIHHEHPLTGRSQCRTQVDSSGRLADAALLVGDGDHPQSRGSHGLAIQGSTLRLAVTLRTTAIRPCVSVMLGMSSTSKRQPTLASSISPWTSRPFHNPTIP